MRVRISLAAPNVKRINDYFYEKCNFESPRVTGNFDVEFVHEKAFRDLGSGFVVVQQC